MIDFLFKTFTGNVIVTLLFVLIVFALSIVFYKSFFKRFYDFVLSLLALIVLSPFFIILIIIGSIALKGNPFFTQLRLGKIDKTGKPRLFKLIKFRTMTNKTNENGALLSDGERLTRYGKFLRGTSLDELPEILNIFLGNMSIVGPRPLLTNYLNYYTESEKERHLVSGGLIPADVVLSNPCPSWNEQLSSDVEYVKKYSLFYDLKLLFLVFIRLVKRKKCDYGSYVRLPLNEERKDIITSEIAFVEGENENIN